MEHQEVERKWLMDAFPPLPALCEVQQQQGYLAFGAATVRIRETVGGETAQYRLTVKGSGTLQRTEVELDLTAGQYAALLPLLAAPAVRKRLRTYALPGGQTLECSLVDEGEATSFYYAEVEFPSAEAARAFVPPAFLGREVTEEPGHSMAAYARRKAGLPFG